MAYEIIEITNGTPSILKKFPEEDFVEALHFFQMGEYLEEGDSLLEMLDAGELWSKKGRGFQLIKK